MCCCLSEVIDGHAAKHTLSLNKTSLLHSFIPECLWVLAEGTEWSNFVLEPTLICVLWSALEGREVLNFHKA